MLGMIPYINRLETPEAIGKGEFALFRETESGYPVQKGDVVLLRTTNGTSVKQVEMVMDGAYVVSADGSPETTEEARRAAVFGILVKSFERLGALGLFSITLGGRAALLFAPLCLLILLVEIKRRPEKQSAPIQVQNYPSETKVSEG